METPTSPPTANPSRSAPPPPLLSPSFLRKPLRAAAAAASACGPLPFPSEDSEESSCVVLFDWWLERVEGDDLKVRVGGHTERNGKPHVFTSAPIVKRHKACVVQTEDNIVVLINGPLDLEQMKENGYTPEVCEDFMIGFPYFWESCDLGSQPSCSNTSNSRDGSIQFYLQESLGNFVDKVGSSFLANLLNKGRSFSGNDADSFEKRSYLSNETPIFEEYTCGPGISAKEKTTAFEEGNKVSPAVCNNVCNEKSGLIAKSNSQEREHDNIDLNASLTSIEEFTTDKTSKETGSQNEFIHPEAEVQEAGRHLFNSDLICDRSTDNMPCEMGDGSANAGSSVGQGSKEFLTTVPLERANLSSDDCSPLTHAKAKSLSVSTPESLKLRRTRSGRVVVPPLIPGEQDRDSCKEEEGSLSIY
uniref:SANTA domain-containing protein n=1 Tax=Leersia perrieri TaxID=77586 RepID=A0A0D9X3N9_9ORYZ